MALWEDKKLLDRILDLLSQREKGYVKFNKARDNINDYFRPDLGSDLSPDGDGSFFGQHIYEGSGPWSARVMARGFQGNLVSPSSDWIAYAMRQPELRDNDVLERWLQDVKEYIADVYKRSNLYQVLPKFTLDGVTIGSPLMFIDEDVAGQTIDFLPQHYKNVFVFYDKRNRPDGVIVKDEHWTAKQIADEFAPGDARKTKLSKQVNRAIDEGNYHAEFTVIRACFRSSHGVWDVDGFRKPRGQWVSVYFEYKTDEEKKNTPLRTEQYFSRPFVVWDIDKSPWESVSRTPAFSAIYDVITQQQMSKNQLENLHLKNRPPMTVLEDHITIADFAPEGLMPVAKEDWNYRPEMMDVVGDIKLTDEQLKKGEQAIKRWFHVDSFIKFTDLTTTLRQQPSVDQNRRIAAELAVQLSPAITTYTEGLLASIDQRVIGIESRAGRGPFAPDVMAEVARAIESVMGGPVLRIGLMPVFIGPLAREQRTQAELDPILNGLAVVSPLLETYPDLKYAIKEYDTLEDICKAVGFPLKNLRQQDEYDKIVAAIQQAQAQLQQQQMLLEGAKAAPGLGKPVDDTSILAKLGAA